MSDASPADQPSTGAEAPPPRPSPCPAILCQSLPARVLAWLLIQLARSLTGARSFWKGCAPEPQQRIYFANHRSHIDFILLWSSLPDELRRRTRPVAGADYWERSRLRRFLIHQVFNGVLIERHPHEAEANPLQPMLDALAAGDSLIIFPEGTRNLLEEGLLPFKGGLFRLGRAFPQVELVPVWISNLNRVMPKGRVLPLPLLCTVSFGAPLHIGPEEEKKAFLGRAREALQELAAEAD